MLGSTLRRAATTRTIANGKAAWGGRRLDERLDERLPDLTTELIELFKPVEIWLHGSVARADDDGDGDLDLLVVFDTYDPADATVMKVTAFRSTTSATGTIERATVLKGCVVFRRE